MNQNDISIEERANINFRAKIELVKYYAKHKKILEWGKVLFPEKFLSPYCYELHNYFIQVRNQEFVWTEAPRYHAKTTIKCFLIQIFQALEEPTDFRHYLNVQATGDKSLDINRGIKIEIEENELLRAVYGDQVGRDRWTDGQFVLRNGVCFTGLGAGQSIRGINYRNNRPDYIVIDDLYDEEDIENQESTQKKNRWFWGSLFSCRAKSKRCSIHVQGTAINTRDLLEELKKKSRWTGKTFSAIKEDGSILWESVNTRESLESDREDMGTIIFNREMQNIRRDDAESIIKLSYLNNWEYDPVVLENKISIANELQLHYVKVGNDPSIGKKEQNDFTGTVLVLETKYKDSTSGSDYWIEGIWNEKLSLNERVKQLERIKNSRPKGRELSKVFIEAISGFNDYADEVIRKTNLPIQRVDRVPDKITNLVNKSKFFENGKIHINKNIDPKLKDLMKYQLTTNYPDHDDVRDALLLTLESNDDSSNLYR